MVKLRVDLPGDGVVARLRRAVLAWGDLAMMRKQLLTLKELAEPARGTTPRAVARGGLDDGDGIGSTQ